MSIRLTPSEQQALTFQEYPAAPSIEGVFYRPLRKHLDVNGWFMEHLRLTGGRVDGLDVEFDTRQVSFSRAAAGRVNAFHVHPKVVQDELWCVVDGCLMVWLVDCREGSPTAGTKRRFILNSDQPALLYIPSGVAHGYKAGPAGALLVYAMNSQFNLADPNEGRLGWDHFGAELWEEDRG